MSAILLETAAGVAPFLAGEARAAGLEVREEGRAHVVVEGPLDRVAELRLYSAAAVPLGDDPVSTLASSPAVAAVADGAVRFRVAEVEGRWELRDQLVERLGWVNDPRGWDVNVRALDGRLVAELGPLFRTRRFGPLERAPASTTPVVAALIAQLAHVADGQLVCDPFCGAGTILVEVARLAPRARLLCTDTSRAALAAARTNLSGTGARVERRDVRSLPVRAGSVDRVVANLPFGKRVGTRREVEDLYPVFAATLERMLAPDGRAVLLTEAKRLLRESLERVRLRVADEVVVETGGLQPSIFVVVRG